MTPEEKTAVINDIASKVQDATKTELESIKEDLKGLDVNALKEMANKEIAEKETVDNLKGQISELSENVNFIKDNMESGSNNQSLAKEFKDKKNEIKDIIAGNKKEVELKAITNRASVANNSQSVFLDDISELARPIPALYDFFPKFPVGDGNHNGTITYFDWDEDTTAKAAAAVAEGSTFPESTAKFQEYSVKLKKIGDTLPVTEEFEQDDTLAAAELQNFINLNVRDERNRQIAVADGTSNTLTGLYPSAPGYTAPNEGIADANIKDLVRRMRTTIVKGKGSKFQPNFVAANSDVIDQYMLKKDANNNYMFDSETGLIAGLQVVEDNNLADNTLVVGDSRYARIYERPGILLSEGQPNGQFLDDAKTIKAKQRLLFLIREADKAGFLKSTDIAADLTALAS